MNQTIQKLITKPLILIRETSKGKQEIVMYITTGYTKERAKEMIEKVKQNYPKDLILVTQLLSVEKLD